MTTHKKNYLQPEVFFPLLKATARKKTSIRTRWVVLTGSPSSGKTTVLKMLAQLGFTIEREKAHDYLIQELQAGHSLDNILLDKASLVSEILRRNLTRQEELPTDEVIVFDRAAPDVLAFSLVDAVDPAEIVDQCVAFRFALAFVFSPLPKRKDGTIYHTHRQRRRITSYCRRIYQILGAQVDTVPRCTMNELDCAVQRISTAIAGLPSH